jgi:hypothetical protein
MENDGFFAVGSGKIPLPRDLHFPYFCVYGQDHQGGLRRIAIGRDAVASVSLQKTKESRIMTLQKQPILRRWLYFFFFFFLKIDSGQNSGTGKSASLRLSLKRFIFFVNRRYRRNGAIVLWEFK